jgi:hypothetical protein
MLDDLCGRKFEAFDSRHANAHPTGFPSMSLGARRFHSGKHLPKSRRRSGTDALQFEITAALTSKTLLPVVYFTIARPYVSRDACNT